MKGWILHGFGDMRWGDLPDPEVRPGWVVLKVLVGQPSISDVLRYQGVGTMHADKVKARLAAGIVPLPGHEFSGKVVEVGPGVSRLKLGDRVCAAGDYHCGECTDCKTGSSKYCQKPHRIGVDGPGCWAEYIALPEWVLAIVPDNVTSFEAAAMQPLCSAVKSASEVQFGDTVVVLGQGVMGLNCMQATKAAGARKVIAIDIRDEALAMSRQYGADAVINSTQTDPVAAVMELTGGRGVDIAYECAGGNPKHGLSGFKTLEQAFQTVRKEGKVVVVAHPLFGEPFPMDLRLLKNKSIHMMMPRLATLNDLQLAVDLVAGKRIVLGPQLTHQLQGIDQVPQAFEITGNKVAHKAMNPAQVRIGQA